MTTRRNFLFGSAAFAGLSVSGIAVMAAPVPPDRFVTLVTAARELIACHNNGPFKIETGSAYYPETGTKSYWERRVIDANRSTFFEQANAFLKLAMDLFPEMPTLAEAERVLEESRALNDVLDVNYLRHQTPSVVSLIMTRALIQHARLPFHMKRVPQFAKLAERYDEGVMGYGDSQDAA